jgi:hypothetical protein
MVWKAKPSPTTTAMLFDRDLPFRNGGKYKSRQSGDVVETMSLLGACWMCTRDKYWELEMCDEAHGSWGQMGTEVACKTWLSGGKLMVTKNTWFAHMFRTQGGDFGFPYPQSGNAINQAREYSRNLWLGNNWDKAIHPLSWLIDKFAPIPGWHDKGIVYYTDNRLDNVIMDVCQKQLSKSANGMPLVSSSLQPMDFGKQNIHLPLERGDLTMFKQILAGLEALDTEIVFFCEHDLLYHPSHFDFVPPEKDKFYYNTNVWKVRYEDGLAVRTDFCQQTSGLCAHRDLLIEHYRKRVEMVERDGFSRKKGFEPGTHGRDERVDDYKAGSWESQYPNIDIRHSQNMTASRWSPDQFRNERYSKGWKEASEVPGWGITKDRFGEILAEA